ncbi:MAG: hypothetical protein OEQ74_09770 [Gammaproteobacteria bacterium]|nr:hypothetical protein [Gammaproteobacteria bacterium]
MKLRIKGDSLRLRLMRGEVATLAATGSLSESMRLPGASLTYTIYTSENATEISARLLDNILEVSLPDAVVQYWANSDEISLSARHGPVSILIEKDFACLTPREGEDDSDAFPHPDKVVCD